MTVEETAKVLRMIQAAYPSYKPASQKDAIEVWQLVFNDIPVQAVVAALRSYMNDAHEFAPNPGQLHSILRTMTNPNELTEAEAWNMVLLALRNGIYGAEEEFNKLPEDIQKAIGSPHYLHELALSEDVNYSVESSNFFRNYRTVRERRKQIENLPDSARKIVDQMRDKVPQVENRQQVAMLEAKENYSNLFESARQKFLENKGNESDEENRENGGMSQWIKDRLRKKDTNETVIAEPEAELGGFA